MTPNTTQYLFTPDFASHDSAGVGGLIMPVSVVTQNHGVTSLTNIDDSSLACAVCQRLEKQSKTFMV